MPNIQYGPYPIKINNLQRSPYKGKLIVYIKFNRNAFTNTVMMTPLSKESLNVFMSLFKGRQDVFAIRWKKDSRCGYMPAYDLNWVEYATHKAKGGALNDFPNKSYSWLTEQRLLKHRQTRLS